MEEIDFQQQNNFNPGQEIEMNQEQENDSVLDQSLENLSVIDLQSQDQGLEVFVASRDGQITALMDILDSFNKETRDVILCKSFVDGEQSCTPLIIAARNGHKGLVATLIQKYSVNLESEGTVKFDGHLIEG